jgi:hypothetical protein
MFRIASRSFWKVVEDCRCSFEFEAVLTTEISRFAMKDDVAEEKDSGVVESGRQEEEKSNVAVRDAPPVALK